MAAGSTRANPVRWGDEQYIMNSQVDRLNSTGVPLLAFLLRARAPGLDAFVAEIAGSRQSYEVVAALHFRR